MEQIAGWRGLPKSIRCDNGPELIAQSFVDWCKDPGINLLHIQSGKLRAMGVATVNAALMRMRKVVGFMLNRQSE